MPTVYKADQKMDEKQWRQLQEATSIVVSMSRTE